MNYSQFDASAVFSGGGFMPPSQSNQNTESAPPVYTKNRETQTLIPLTVNQINKALLSNDDKVNFLINGVDINNVKLVGMVCNKTVRVTDVNFVLDDGTGRIDCNRQYMGNDPLDTKEMDAIMDGTYVRVHGQLKGFQGKMQLKIYGIKPVTDFNEITYHLVECIYVHSYNTKLMKQQPGSSSHGYMQSAVANTQTYQTAPSNRFAGRYIADGINEVDNMVRDYLMLPASLSREQGVHEEELVAQLGIPLDKIQASVKFLVEEGFAYTTIDDKHCKCTANG